MTHDQSAKAMEKSNCEQNNCVCDFCRDVQDMLLNLPEEKLRDLEIMCISEDIQDIALKFNNDESIVGEALIDATVCFCLDRIYTGYRGDIDDFLTLVRRSAETYADFSDSFEELLAYNPNDMKESSKSNFPEDHFLNDNDDSECPVVGLRRHP